MPTTGGPARRLTIHEAYEGDPIWSPDGRQLAFSSQRHGNSDVFVMQATGSVPRYVRMPFRAW